MPVLRITCTTTASGGTDAVRAGAAAGRVVAAALDLPPDAVLPQVTAAEAGVPSVLAVIHGRHRTAEQVTAAVDRLGRHLCDAFALDPGHVVVCWPAPGVSGDGTGAHS